MVHNFPMYCTRSSVQVLEKTSEDGVHQNTGEWEILVITDELDAILDGPFSDRRGGGVPLATNGPMADGVALLDDRIRGVAFPARSTEKSTVEHENGLLGSAAMLFDLAQTQYSLTPSLNRYLNPPSSHRLSLFWFNFILLGRRFYSFRHFHRIFFIHYSLSHPVSIDHTAPLVVQSPSSPTTGPIAIRALFGHSFGVPMLFGYQLPSELVLHKRSLLPFSPSSTLWPPSPGLKNMA
jgi:hypothetical protein